MAGTKVNASHSIFLNYRGRRYENALQLSESLIEVMFLVSKPQI